MNMFLSISFNILYICAQHSCLNEAILLSTQNLQFFWSYLEALNSYYGTDSTRLRGASVHAHVTCLATNACLTADIWVAS